MDEISDPKAMRALAHPARLAMINQLGIVGTATATQLAEVVGVTPSAASYHLRMLAKYGFVEDAPPGDDGRERLWKARLESYNIAYEPGMPLDRRAARDLLVDTVRNDAADEVKRALAQLDHEPKEWREAALMSRAQLLATAEELQELGERISELIEPYLARERRNAIPVGARAAEAQVYLFAKADRRVPGIPTEDHDHR